MFHAADATLYLTRQDFRLLPVLEGLQHGFTATGFDREACAALLRATVEKLDLGHFFDADALLRGERFISDALLYPQPGHWRALLLPSVPERDGHPRLLPLADDVIAPLGDWLRTRGAASEPAHYARGVELLGQEAMDWLGRPVVEHPPLRTPTGPGVYRREHASLLVATETTSLLVDPIALQRTLPCLELLSSDLPRVDAIAITHGHFDHWHVPSLLHAARERDVPVITPRIPRETLLAPERFEETLACLGQRALPTAWGEVVRVGDIEIEVLPFYGEQPSFDGSGPPRDVRNWGNVYRIDTSGFSIAVLADSGTDPAGSMEQALADSRARRGPIDVVFACLRDMQGPFHDGLPADLFTLEWNELERLWSRHQAGRSPSTTAGMDGLPAICHAAGARAFYPYSDGFAGLREPIADIGWGGNEPSEAQALAVLAQRVRTSGGSTEVRAWLNDDRLTFVGREPSVAPRA